MDRGMLSAAVAVVLLGAVGVAAATGAVPVGNGPAVSAEEAGSIAEKRVGGEAVDVEFEDEDGEAPVYEVTVERDGPTFEVEVDGETGDVLEVEREDDGETGDVLEVEREDDGEETEAEDDTGTDDDEETAAEDDGDEVAAGDDG